MTTGDVVYSLRFSLIKILPEPGFDLGSAAGDSCMLTARLHMLPVYTIILLLSEIYEKNTSVCLDNYVTTKHAQKDINLRKKCGNMYIYRYFRFLIFCMICSTLPSLSIRKK